MQNRRPNAISRYIALPIRQWLYKASTILLVTAGCVLVILSRADSPALRHIRASINDIVVPVLEVAASPSHAVADLMAWTHDTVQMRDENVRLKGENAQLLQWQSSAKQLEAENKALRKLLNVALPSQSTYVSARIVGDAGGPYVHAALLAAGRGDGVTENQAVMTEAGLVGRIIEAGDHSARVLLLTDINSRVPVIGEESRERGILAGDNSGALSLHYLLADTKIRLGERLVTSGDGGVFPPGIPVGMVQNVDGHKVSVTPLVNRSDLEYVRVIDFRL